MIKLVLPSGVKLFLLDNVSPEDAATLMALYARFPESVELQVEKVYTERRRALHDAIDAFCVNDTNALHAVEAVMGVWSENNATARAKRLGDRYVNGYGHRSIGDNGYAALFVEGGPMLLAKALQDTPLYNGQEMSSRAVDCGDQAYCDPLGTDASRAVLEGWRALYKRTLPAAAEETRRRHPRKPDEDPATYDKAVAMRAFDIARGVLPFGCATNVGWSGTLRHLGDRLAFLCHHPDQGVREVAAGLLSMCAERYPSSGFGGAGAVSGVGFLNEQETARANRTAWTVKAMQSLAYMPEPDERLPEQLTIDTDALRVRLHAAHPDVKARLADRPRGALLPHALLSLGMADLEFPLDMGSWRDAQRQRAIVVEPSILSTRYGFEPWYIEQLPGGEGAERGPWQVNAQKYVGFAEEVALTVNVLARQAEALTSDPVLRQYYLPLGFRVRTRISAGLPGLVYALELRTGKAIHPTLRRRMLEASKAFKHAFPGVALHVDEDPDDWTIRRGKAVITEKTDASR